MNDPILLAINSNLIYYALKLKQQMICTLESNPCYTLLSSLIFSSPIWSWECDHRMVAMTFSTFMITWSISANFCFYSIFCQNFYCSLRIDLLPNQPILLSSSRVFLLILYSILCLTSWFIGNSMMLSYLTDISSENFTASLAPSFVIL